MTTPRLMIRRRFLSRLCRFAHNLNTPVAHPPAHLAFEDPRLLVAPVSSSSSSRLGYVHIAVHLLHLMLTIFASRWEKIGKVRG